MSYAQMAYNNKTATSGNYTWVCWTNSHFKILITDNIGIIMINEVWHILTRPKVSLSLIVH